MLVLPGRWPVTQLNYHVQLVNYHVQLGVSRADY